MNNLKDVKEGLNRYLTYLNNTDKNDTLYNEEVHSIRGDLIRVHRFMYNNLEELSKNDIQILIEKIIQIEEIAYHK